MPRAQQLILIGWLLEGLVLIGLGELFRRLFRAPSQGPEDHLRSFWLGWACLLCGLQLWHLFLPVNTESRVFTTMLGALGLWCGGAHPWRCWLRGVRRHPVVVVAAAAAVFWLSNHAMGGPRFGDSGAYHIPLVRWAVEYPAIPGLGNLYGLFGQAQSYFLYLAWLDVGPFTGRSYHLANSLLVVALVARASLGAARLARRDGARRAADLFYVLFLPPVVHQALGIFLTSPSPDLVIFVLGVVVSGELMPFLVQTERPGVDRFRWYALTLIAASAVTVKLSITGLSLTAIAIATAAWSHALRQPPKAALCTAQGPLGQPQDVGWCQGERPQRTSTIGTIATVGALAAVTLVPWMARHVILTGCPFYPSRFAALPVEWRVSLDMVEWTRRPMEIDLRAAVFHPQWLLGRLETLGWADPEVLAALGLAAGATIIGAMARLLRRGRAAPQRLSAVALLPAAVSFLSCFLAAPMPRYFGATLWLLAVQATLVGIGDLAIARRWARVAAVAIVVAVVGLQLRAAPEPLRRLTDFETIGRTPVASARLPSGLVVQVPLKGHCWEAPLPCTPAPHRGLRLRRAGDLRWGFAIDPSLQ